MENIKLADLKPGMKVRIKKNPPCEDWVCEMDKYKGTVMTVRKVTLKGAHMEEDKGEHFGDGWLWWLRFIEGIIPNQNIHITTDGTTTHAVLKNGKTVVKRATATCAPDDTFDFAVGAKLALERVLAVNGVSIEAKRDYLKKLEAAQLLYPNLPYIAKDENGRVYLYENEPTKNSSVWAVRDDCRELHLDFPLISWSDPEPVHIPTEIEKLRKELEAQS